MTSYPVSATRIHSSPSTNPSEGDLLECPKGHLDSNFPPRPTCEFLVGPSPPAPRRANHTGRHPTEPRTRIFLLSAGDFDSDRPYHLVGFGSGGAVATFYASHFATPSPRSLLLLNSFSYVDAYLAGVLHDCMNVFNCAPESRPDLPVYFHARFLFSPAYLGQARRVL